MTSAVFAPRARRDVLAAAGWIARDNPRVAEAFRDAVLSAAERIGTHPAIGVERPQLADAPVRFLAMAGLLYIVVYDSDRVPPLILRVLHGARDLPDVLQDL